MNASAHPHLAIIGNGMAAGRLLDELIRRDALRRYRISVFGEEPQGCYNRILLHRMLAGGSLDEILLKPPSWYQAHGIALYNSMVTSLDPSHLTLTTADGQAHSFDLAVLATGSVPVVPPLEGLSCAEGKWRAGVATYRTVADCVRMRQWIAPGKVAVILGGGLLGLEAAKTLHDLHMQVTVLHAAGWLMNRQLDAVAGAFLQRSLERHGLQIQTGVRVIGLTGGGAVQGVRLADGKVLPADLVVLACGVRPRVELATAAGLSVRHGVLVDDQLRTSHPRIYAVGECAEHRGIVYGIVSPLYEQCRVLADVLSGGQTQARYRGSACYTRLKVAGIQVASMGRIEPQDELDEVVQVIESQRGIYRKLIIRDEQLVGAILIGDTSTAATLIRRLERGDLLPSNRLDLLASPLRRDSSDTEAVICHCNQVRRQQLLWAIEHGCKTLTELGNRTGAGTGCGSCRGQLARLLLQHATSVVAGG